MNNENIVPILTFTSMFDDPSSGSKSKTYLPILWWAGMWIMSSSSSEAITQKWPPWSIALIIISWANISSFLTCSPWILLSPVKPKISTNPALLTSKEITLAAKPSWLSIAESSPVASGWSFSPSWMWRGRVIKCGISAPLLYAVFVISWSLYCNWYSL